MGLVTIFEHIAPALRVLTGIEVVSKVPMDRPDLFVRIDQGVPVAKSPGTEEATVAIQVYGTDLERVLTVIHQIRFFMLDKVYSDVPQVYDWDEIQGPHDFPDPDLTDVFRWQISGTLAAFIAP